MKAIMLWLKHSGDTNEIVIGASAIGNGSNTVTLGNTSIVKTILQGNVGIGTATPGQKLDVAGNINVNTNGTAVLISSYKPTSTVGNNIFIGGGGQSSIYDGTNSYTGSYNTAVGVSALYSNTTGYQNTANGVSALQSNTTGFQNTANGMSALYYNTTGNYNTANGVSALQSNTTGYQNTANGMQALSSNTTGYNNTANGVNALHSNTTGNQNTANGLNALLSNTTGYNNTANGMSAGRFIADGVTANQTSNNSVYEGYNAMAQASGDTNEIVIGASAIGNGSNTVTLGNTSIVKTILNGNVGIGTTSPGSLLDVNGATTATSSNNYNSGAIRTTGNYWNGTASAADYWSLQNVLGTGSNPTSTLTFAHSGSTGVASVAFPAPVKLKNYTVATLPTGVTGMTAYISDGDSGLAWGATAVNSGSGATPYMVWFNGTNWTVTGK